MKRCLLLLSFLLSGCEAKIETHTTENRAPRDGDLKIVDYHDGTYEVERFYDHPGWHVLSFSHRSLENAHELVKVLTEPPTDLPTEKGQP